MVAKTKRLTKAAVALATTALLERAIEKAMKAAKDPRVRREVAKLGKMAIARGKKAAAAAGREARRLERVVKKQAPVVRRKAAKRIRRWAKAS